MASNSITWEQGVKLDQFASTAEERRQKLSEVIHWFAKNTHAQILAMDLMLDSFDLLTYYDKKDYSQFLFDKTDELLRNVEEVKAKLIPLKEEFQKVAAINPQNNNNDRESN